MHYSVTGFIAGIIGAFIKTFFRFFGRFAAFVLSWKFIVMVFLLLVGVYLYSQETRTTVVDFPQVSAEGSQQLHQFVGPMDCQELLVDFHDEVPLEAMMALDAQLPGKFQDSGGYDRPKLRTIDSQDCETDLQVIRGYPWVQAADIHGQYHALGLLDLLDSKPNDPLYEKQWNMRMVDAEYVWANTKSGEGVVVAVLDTGVQIQEDLNPQTVLKGETFAGGSVGRDPNGHGTHVSGTIAQWTNNGKGVTGLAKNAQVLPVKVLSDHGSGSHEGIAEGIHWAVDQGADIINMSLGGPQPSDVMREAVNYAVGKGVLVVAAAGNSSSPRVGYPAGYEGVICVSSVGPAGELSYFSNYGPRIDIAAPGGDKQQGEDGAILQATCPGGTCGYYGFQGTSMASPHVAAAAAVLLGEGADPGDVPELLKTKAERDDEFGYGIINMKASLDKLGPPGGCDG